MYAPCLRLMSCVGRPLFSAISVGATIAAPIAGAQTPTVPFNLLPSIVQDYVYGYAPVAIAATRALLTAVPDATTFPGLAPVNQLGRSNSLAGPKSVIIRPNADTLYTDAWLDLSREPIILHVPDTAGRYYLIPMLDAYSNDFASIGSRTTGDGEGNYAIVGPFWHGSLPPEVSGAIRTPTNNVWLIGRTLVRGEFDLADAVAVTDQYQLVPLSAFPKFLATGKYTPPSNVPVTQPNPDFVGLPATNGVGFSKPEFFDVLALAALQNPPPLDQALQASRFVLDGFIRQNQLNASVVQQAMDALVNEQLTTGVQQNGWTIDLNSGDYGTDYLKRAAVARFGLGANIPADAVYPHTETDITGNPLVGTKSYAIHFAPHQTPPVHGFWSVTVYDENGLLVANPIKRYSLGSETGLAPNPDESIDIVLQNPSATTLPNNWLPTPSGSFNLTLRLFWPDHAILDGTYVIPPVEPLATAVP